MNLRQLGVAALVAVASLSCDGGGPKNGELLVNLVTPNGGDAAILIRVDGSGSKTVTGATAVCPGCRVFAISTSDTRLDAVVTGDLTSGPLVRLAVSDVGSVGSYSLTVTQVASGDHRLRGLVGYKLEFGR
ncbi:MAG: hypothetical protein ACE5HT_00290 [Gemmatimonadales bacterium]